VTKVGSAPGAAGQVDWTDGTVPDRLPHAVWRSPLVELQRQQALLRFPTVGRFLVPTEGPPTVERQAGVGRADVDCFVNGPLRALQGLLGGQFALRGSAVVVEGEALLIAGCSGAGKSALAAALMRSGSPVVADGYVFVDAGARPTVRVTPTKLALWPDTVRALGMDSADGDLVRPGLAKRAFASPLPPIGPSIPVRKLVVLSIGTERGGQGPIVETRPLDLPAAIERTAALGYLGQAIKPLGLSGHHARWLMSLVSLQPVELSRRGGDMAESLTELARAVLGR
jgi:hypothetical protein